MSRTTSPACPITVDGNKLVGILTRRDLKFLTPADNRCIDQVMTKTNLVTAPPDTTLEDAEKILHRHKVEKLLLVHPDGTLGGLITIRDIDRSLTFPTTCKDARGRLRVGAAVGVHDYERGRGPDRQRRGCDRGRLRPRPQRERHRDRPQHPQDIDIESSPAISPPPTAPPI